MWPLPNEVSSGRWCLCSRFRAETQNHEPSRQISVPVPRGTLGFKRAGVAEGRDVTQTDDGLWRNEGDGATITCSHTKGAGYIQMCWFRQLPGECSQHSEHSRISGTSARRNSEPPKRRRRAEGGGWRVWRLQAQA